MCCNIVISADQLGTDAPADDSHDELDSRLKSRTDASASSLLNECLTNEVDRGNWSSSDAVG